MVPALLAGLLALIIMYANLNAKLNHQNESTSIIYLLFGD